MNKNSNIIIALLIVVIGMMIYNNCNLKGKPSSDANQPVTTDKTPPGDIQKGDQKIDELTKESVVVPFVKKMGKLPDCYISKKEAREKGWDAASGNLCEVLPGKAIGGDVFTNREGSLPVKTGRTWYEADLNYSCGRRNADRLLFSSDGLVFVTHDHYKTFEEK